MNVSVSEFDWDDGNRDKCSKHGVSIAEIEALFTKTIMILPDEQHSTEETRLKAIGKTEAGRHVFIVFTLREREGKTYTRPISARCIHQREVENYERENPDIRD